MSDHVYKSIELTGTSTVGVVPAIEGAVIKASESLHNMRWFEVTDIRGEIDNGHVSHWQVTLKLGFTLDGRADD